MHSCNIPCSLRHSHAAIWLGGYITIASKATRRVVQEECKQIKFASCICVNMDKQREKRRLTENWRRKKHEEKKGTQEQKRKDRRSAKERDWIINEILKEEASSFRDYDFAAEVSPKNSTFQIFFQNHFASHGIVVSKTELSQFASFHDFGSQTEILRLLTLRWSGATCSSFLWSGYQKAHGEGC
ncbi:hypothetical protein ZWY2020_039899 [Hordeum vulgare]|nr:hypothetical protein ZWY2020_039899 [Hordeum vulgare]